jgi:hypothetical protein
MHRNQFKAKLYTWIGAIIWVLTVIGSGSAIIYKIDRKDVEIAGGLALYCYDTIHTYIWILLLSIPLVISGLQLIRSKIVDPWIWENIHHVLDKFQNFVFKDRKSTLLHHHRATLFKYKKRNLSLNRFCLTPCLVPVVRSGHAKQKTKTIFKVPDSMDDAQGIAGLTWARGGIASVNNLPEITEKSSLSEIEEYARSTKIELDWVSERKNKNLPRALCGIPIEVNGSLWGVLVLDSREPEQIGTNQMFDMFTLIGSSIGKLLERS